MDSMRKKLQELQEQGFLDADTVNEMLKGFEDPGPKGARKGATAVAIAEGPGSSARAVSGGAGLVVARAGPGETVEEVKIKDSE